MNFDADSLFMSLPSVMQLPNLRLVGRVWYGPYRIDGSLHSRRDKMVIRQGDRDGMPLVMEQGGSAVTLWTWLVRYGGLSNDDVRAVFRDCKGKDLNFVPAIYEDKPPKYIEPWRFIEHGGTKYGNCPLFAFLSRIYGRDRVSVAFERYNVSNGIKSRISGILGTRFWYKDKTGGLCFDKTMFYKDDGHRSKMDFPLRYFKKRDGYSYGCLFGEDSLVEGRPVFVVESEKTAIICWLEYPSFNWVACGGKNGLRMLDRLSGYDVWLVPDVDAIDEWSKAGKVWNWWRRCGKSVGEKWDIADYILTLHHVD